MTRDSGSIVLGWLTKLVATLAVLGVLAFDGIALVKTSFSAADEANSIAGVAADTYKSTHNVQKSYDAAAAEAAKTSDTVDVKNFIVRETDGHVTLTIHKLATTLWMHRIGALKKYTEDSATGEGSPPQ